jgi:signal transduction histidine kinase
MVRIINDALSLAHGIDEGDLEVVSLAQVAAPCWHGDAERIHVTDDLRFRADRDRLQRLLENLFRNSVEHGSTSSQNASRSDDSVEHGSTGPRSQAREDSAELRSASSRTESDDSVEQRSTGNRTESGDSVEHGSTGSRSQADDESGDARGVTVRLGPLSDAPGFFVEDDGPGVPERDREAVFEFGYTTTKEGTGLGLGIVRRIAETHGWECRLTSGRDGGARFEFVGVEVADANGVEQVGGATGG